MRETVAGIPHRPRQGDGHGGTRHDGGHGDARGGGWRLTVPGARRE